MLWSIYFLQEKYYDTTANMIAIFMMDVASQSELRNNFRKASSTWGQLAANMYSTNDLQDRTFLSHFWALANEVIYY